MPNKTSMHKLNRKNLISTHDLSLDEINLILDESMNFVDYVERKESLSLMKGKILAALFYEPSTRTRLSFESAMLRLGGQVINAVGMENSSINKGETLYDTARVISQFADIAAIRHPAKGSASDFAAGSSIPVINGGDGIGEHPTQALLDLLTLKREFKSLNDFSISLVGDLKYGRTVHSLVYLLAKFGIKIIFVSPHGLKMPEEIIQDLKNLQVNFEENSDFEGALKKSDVVYMTRIQKERFVDVSEYELYSKSFVLNKDTILRLNSDLKILHPLPRVNELHQDVDSLPGALYFDQVQNGVALRMALIKLLLTN